MKSPFTIVVVSLLFGCSGNETRHSDNTGGALAVGGDQGSAGTLANSGGVATKPIGTSTSSFGVEGTASTAGAPSSASGGAPMSTTTGGPSGGSSAAGGVTATGGSPTGVGGVAFGGSNRGGAGTSNGGAAANGGVAGGTTGKTNTGGTTNAGGSSSSVSRPIQAYDGARGTCFNDGWKFYLGDPTNAQVPSFSDSAWTSLSVPHDWSQTLGMNQSSPGGSAEGYSLGGVGWYRKTFSLDSSYAGKNIFIEFDGVYYNSQVWINGTSLGTWPYGYTTFQYDLTPYVKTDGATNVIAVRVNNKQPSSRWYTGSGIYRNVWLTALDPVHVAFNGSFVTTPSVSTASASISVATEVENHRNASESVTAVANIYDANGTLVTTNTCAPSSIEPNGKATLTQSLTVPNPQLWSVDTPTLYEVKVELQVGGRTVDTYVSPIGLRWFKFDPNTGFSLNDKPMKIWGTCMHHDLGALGSAVNVRAIERQLQILKGMGTNGVRTSHNPPAPELLDLADRMGLLIMDEAFDVWETGKSGVTYGYQNYFKDWAQKDIQAQVRRDRNHPSVIFWSIGNEIPGATAATGQKLRDWVKALDTTRPVGWGANFMKTDQGQRAVAALLDLQGYNYFVGDANIDTGNFTLDNDHKSNQTWKIFGSEELSNVKSRGIYTTQGTNLHWTGCSNQQCTSYDVGWGDGFNTEEMYLINTKRPFFFGQFDWTGFDYGGEPTPYGWPSKGSYFGTVDTAGFPKDIYYFYQSKLTSAPMVHLLPHWNWSSGTTVWVWAYSNCDSVELFVNGVSQGSKSITSSTTRLEWNVPWASGTLRAEGKRNGSVVATQEIKTSGQPAQVKLTADRTKIHADGRDLVFVTADIQDNSGVFVPTAINSVTFSVSGPGRLVGVDNGDATDTTNYTSPTRKAFSGKVLAIVQSTGSAGQITLSATSSGLTADSVSTNAN